MLGGSGKGRGRVDGAADPRASQPGERKVSHDQEGGSAGPDKVEALVGSLGWRSVTWGQAARLRPRGGGLGPRVTAAMAGEKRISVEAEGGCMRVHTA